MPRLYPILIDIARISKMRYNGCEVSTFALDLEPVSIAPAALVEQFVGNNIGMKLKCFRVIFML